MHCIMLLSHLPYPIHPITSEIKKSGWNEVHIDDTFSLYKRRVTVPGRDGPGPVEYLMMGRFEDVSPRVFLYSQIDRMCRVVWDKTMGDMSEAQLTTHKQQQHHQRSGNSSRCVEEDTLYYRTRWPWPLKDRDYVLARRYVSNRQIGCIVCTAIHDLASWVEHCVTAVTTGVRCSTPRMRSC